MTGRWPAGLWWCPDLSVPVAATPLAAVLWSTPIHLHTGVRYVP